MLVPRGPSDLGGGLGVLARVGYGCGWWSLEDLQILGGGFGVLAREGGGLGVLAREGVALAFLPGSEMGVDGGP